MSQTSPDHNLRLRLRLAAVFLIVAALIWLAIAYQIRNAKEEALNAAREQGANIAGIVAEHFSSYSNTIDLWLQHLRIRWINDPEHFDNTVTLEKGLLKNTFVFQVGIIDAEGWLVYSNLSRSPERVFLGDRPHFRIHKDSSVDQLYISKPVKDRVSGQISIQFTRPIYGAKSEFAGILVLSISPRELIRVYQAVDLGSQGVITLRHVDGTIMARSRDYEIALPQRLSKLPNLGADGKDLARVIRRSLVDGIERIFSYRKLAEHPLIVVVGLSMEEALARYYQQRRAYVIGGTLVSFVLLLLMLATNFWLKQKEQADRELRESAKRYRQFFDLSPDGILIHTEGNVALVNDACLELFGAATAEQLIGKPILDCFHPDYHEAIKERVHRLTQENCSVPLLEEKIVKLDGTNVDVEVTGASFTHMGKPAVQVVLRDIAERKKAEKREAYLAQYDSLTGLPNRDLFRDRLVHALARAQRNTQAVALMYLGLDRFKDINEALGHAVGDEVLQVAAGLLRGSLRGVDSIARLGGDEFTIILENVAGKDQVTAVAERVKKAFSDPIVIHEREIIVPVSIGIALYPFDATDSGTLLQYADVAMYHAKEAGRDKYEFYAPEMNAQAGERFSMEGLLRRALERQEFVLHYQPKLDLAKGHISGLEALIRWNDPESGLVPPARFIPLLEETGMILDVGAWAIRKALTDYREWRIQGLQPPRIAVNVSLVQLRQKNFVDMVSKAIEESKAMPHGLDLEITESLIMDDVEGSITKLKALREMQVNIAIDDFGTGYSSLGYLARLPINALKIDRSFIITMTKDADSMTIVSTIIALAHSLNMKVIAEGVETEEQSRLLKLLKCEEIQGYLFSKPLPMEQMTKLLEGRTGT